MPQRENLCKGEKAGLDRSGILFFNGEKQRLRRMDMKKTIQRFAAAALAAVLLAGLAGCGGRPPRGQEKDQKDRTPEYTVTTPRPAAPETVPEPAPLPTEPPASTPVPAATAAPASAFGVEDRDAWLGTVWYGGCRDENGFAGGFFMLAAFTEEMLCNLFLMEGIEGAVFEEPINSDAVFRVYVNGETEPAFSLYGYDADGNPMDPMDTPYRIQLESDWNHMPEFLLGVQGVLLNLAADREEFETRYHMLAEGGGRDFVERENELARSNGEEPVWGDEYATKDMTAAPFYFLYDMRGDGPVLMMENLHG